jgi:hypothetical protein
MFIIFLAVLVGVILITLNVPIIFMLYYIACCIFLIAYLRNKKHENSAFILFAVGLVGIMIFGILLTPMELIKSIAEGQAKIHYQSIYRNTSFVASDVTLLSNGSYHVRVLVYAGKFGVGALNETVKLTIFHRLASYTFVSFNALIAISALVIIIKDNLTLPKSQDYRIFKKRERKNSIVNQMLSIIIVNVLIILFLSREEFIIYAAETMETAKTSAYYIGITNPYRMAINSDISTQFGNFKIGANIYIILLYIIFLSSAILMIIGKKYKKYQPEKFNAFCFASLALFLVSTIGLCFSEFFVNINIPNLAKNINQYTNYTYFFAYSSTNAFLIYRIISCVSITGFYSFIIYQNFIRIREEKRAIKNKNVIVDLTSE